MAELKPCKCGKKVKIFKEDDVYSQNYGLYYTGCCGRYVYAETKQAAIDAWNKRS